MARATSFSAALCAALVFAAGPAFAIGDSYGAIAYSPATGVVSWSHSYPTQRRAEGRALNDCAPYARDCRIAIWFKNGCGAIAIGSNGWGAGWGSNPARAEAEALQVCNRHSRGCQTRRWQCSGAR